MRSTHILYLLLGWAFLGAACGQTSDTTGTESSEDSETMLARVEAAMAAPGRSADDKAIDSMRRPVEILTFMGIEASMSVLDASAGEGYYAELVAAAVGPDGLVYAQNSPAALTRGDGALNTAVTARLAGNRLPNVRRADSDLGDLGMDGEFDAALAFLTLHDQLHFRGEEGALAFLEGVSAALKPGGLLAFIDHVGVTGQDNRELHRMLTADAERLLTAAGFVIEARSDLLANPDDDHTLNVFDPNIRRRTDRIVILASKP